MKKHLIIVTIVLLLLGCSKSVPEDKVDYIGQWRGNDMTLDIHPNGAVSYRRNKKNGSYISINSSLKKFDGNNFDIGIPFIDTTFIVSTPPHKVNGEWKMTVDGLELTKVRRY